MRPVNLLPEKLRPRERKDGSGGAYVVLGVLGVLLVGVVLYVVTANQVTARKAETEQLKAETMAAEQRAGALAQFGAFQEMKESRTASVALLAVGRVDWERMALELSRLLPSGVWLRELDATATGEEAGGTSTTSSSTGSSSGSSGSAAAGAGEDEQVPHLKLIGCAPNQQSVAETMVRLRRLHGAQEVQLVNSLLPEEESSPSAGQGQSGSAAQPSGGFEGCGTRRGHRNYEFEVSVKLAPTPDSLPDGGRVPTSLGGGA